MRKLFGILALAAAVPVSSWAQLAPYNRMGVTWAHVHIRAKDRTKETFALMSLGARLGNNLSPNVNVVFPGLLILLLEGDQPPKGGTEGTVVDHIAFRVPDLPDTLARVKAANWGMHAKDVPEAKPGQAFLMTPSEVKIELIEDKKLKQPIVFDHAHFYVAQPSLKEMEDYYKTMFGAEGDGDTLACREAS
jgi:catechol 2,3-dioxygenase-like lactoylglutathione lyase family enzyme